MGSGLSNEGKFRQRVDDHYRLMARAKAEIGRAHRLQLGSALGFGTILGLCGVEGDTGAIVLGAFCLVIMLASGLSSQAAIAAAGSKDAEKHAISYVGWSRLTGLLVVVLSVVGYGLREFKVVPEPLAQLLFSYGVCALLDLVGCVLGYLGGMKLVAAFDAQKKKANK